MEKNFFLVIIVFCSFIILFPSYAGYEEYYPPYTKDTKPKHLCEIHELIGSDNHKYTSDGLFIQLDTQKSSKYSWDLILTSLKIKGKILVSNKIISSVRWQSLSSRVYWSFLNNDNEKDFIVVLADNELYIDIIFILSNKKEGYSSISLHSKAFSPDLFYDFNNDQRCEFLYLQVIGGSRYPKKPTKKIAKLLNEYGYTGRIYIPTYVMYNILSFDKINPRYNNKLSKYFPRWIEAKKEMYEYGNSANNLSFDQYGHIPNSKAATLPEKQKKMLWKDYLNGVDDAFGDPWK